MSVLSEPHFHDEAAAYEFVEAKIWPNGPVCPHCGGVERISKMGGKSTRLGAYKCYQCRKPFTVKIGTVFEASCVVPEFNGALSILSRQEKDALWEVFFTAAPARRRVFEPSSKRRKRAPGPLRSATD